MPSPPLLYSSPSSDHPATSLPMSIWGNFSAPWSLSFFIGKMGLMICLSEFLCCRVHAQCLTKWHRSQVLPSATASSLKTTPSPDLSLEIPAECIRTYALNTSHNLHWKKEETNWRIKEKEPTQAAWDCRSWAWSGLWDVSFAGWDYNCKRVPSFVLKPYSWTCCSAVMMES